MFGQKGINQEEDRRQSTDTLLLGGAAGSVTTVSCVGLTESWPGHTQAELFLLAPRNAGAGAQERRATLLQRRGDLLELVAGEEGALPPELRAPAVRRPRLRPERPGARGVWAVPPALALQGASPEDLSEVRCSMSHKNVVTRKN